MMVIFTYDVLKFVKYFYDTNLAREINGEMTHSHLSVFNIDEGLMGKRYISGSE